jgi:hypothetical protein
VVGAFGVQAGEKLGEEAHFVHYDPEPLPSEEHEPEQAQRVEDARLQQRRLVPERQQRRVLNEFPADVGR